MMSIKLYFTISALLLAQSWYVTLGNPLPSPPLDAGLSKTLLKNVKEFLDRNDRDFEDKNQLFNSFECAKMPMELHSEALTGCFPNQGQSTTCSSEQSSFSKNTCQRSIKVNLEHYAKALQTYQDADQTTDLKIIIQTIHKLLENFSQEKIPLQTSTKDPDQLTFDQRMCLCKMLRGFHTRVITINRAVNYINSGEGQ